MTIILVKISSNLIISDKSGSRSIFPSNCIKSNKHLQNVLTALVFTILLLNVSTFESAHLWNNCCMLNVSCVRLYK